MVSPLTQTVTFWQNQLVPLPRPFRPFRNKVLISPPHFPEFLVRLAFPPAVIHHGLVVTEQGWCILDLPRPGHAVAEKPQGQQKCRSRGDRDRHMFQQAWGYIHIHTYIINSDIMYIYIIYNICILYDIIYK